MISLRSHTWEVTEPGLTQSGSKPVLKHSMYCLYLHALVDMLPFPLQIFTDSSIIGWKGRQTARLAQPLIHLSPVWRWASPSCHVDGGRLTHGTCVLTVGSYQVLSHQGAESACCSRPLSQGPCDPASPIRHSGQATWKLMIKLQVLPCLA